MILSHLLLILHKTIKFYIFMFEAWNVAKGRKVQGGRILSQGTVIAKIYLTIKSKSVNHFKFLILSKRDGKIFLFFEFTDSKGNTPTLRHHLQRSICV
jgi:hypothetical protein